VTDAIVLRGLRVDARVGVTDDERARPQTVVVDVDIAADLSKAAASDDVGDTIDYGAAVSAIADAVRRSETRLLERLAADVASVLSRMDGVEAVTVEIRKASPPVSEDVEGIGVRIEVSR
jgi:7,8-dihydroneopterin aldolase/epimerase/oxygenase